MTPDPPPAPRYSLAPLIGLYGEDKPVLDIYERGGLLFADGCGFAHALLVEREPGRHCSISGEILVHLEDDRAVARVYGTPMMRRDFAGEALSRFQQAIHGDLTALRQLSLDAEPPPETCAPVPAALVEINGIDPTIQIDMRYASTNNFMGIALYDHPAALLQPAAAGALAQVQAALKPYSCGLVVLDAYRPWSVTWMFWEAVPKALRQFVADPALGSKHNRGCAVDVTLCTISNRALIAMPSAFDEASARAHPDYYGGTSRARWHRDLLRATMEKSGFSVDPCEWWHFDFGEWQNYPIRNERVAALVSSN